MNNYKKIGIIGGMGPESTALLYRGIVRSFQIGFGAYNDEDFPEMVIHNLPIPDITVNVEKEDLVRRMLSRSIHFLEQSGVELIAFPCNSLNYFVDYLTSQTGIPIISIVEETCVTIREKGSKEVLLLSTPTTFEKGLYHRYLRDTTIVRPNDYSKIQSIIVRTLKGENSREDFIEMLEKEYSAHKNIVIGCTDLSVLVESYKNDRLIDSSKCLADSICHKCVIN
ncbi:MAG: amino acid racemase [Candidatus Daviesbacteria bacterium]|nr:amino acid racemase [Candidatus Daviesbacteria bacterium]